MDASPSTSTPSWNSWLGQRSRQFLLFARSQTRCEADAHDVLQDSLVETWRRAGHKAPDDALVYATIRRRAIDLFRSTERRQRREQTAYEILWLDQPADGPGIDPALDEAVQRLPNHLREVLIVRIWGGLTFQQIAHSLDIPADTAASRYRYALDHLRRSMKQPEGAQPASPHLP